MNKEQIRIKFDSEHPGYSTNQIHSYPERIRKYYLEYKRKFPHRVKARDIVKSLVRNGTLKRLPCEFCGYIKSQAHHPDYTQPTKVMWLCPTHHKEWHKNNKVIDF